LVVVPTLDLAAQTALAWRRDGHLEHMVIVPCRGRGGGREAATAEHGDPGPDHRHP
jgi:hypothetical protein